MLISWTGDQRGWGLKTESRIPKNTLVVEYVGELLTEEQADYREHSRMIHHPAEAVVLYQIANDSGLGEERRGGGGREASNKEAAPKSSEVFAIDPWNQGNLARMINHSCDPNLQSYPLQHSNSVKQYLNSVLRGNVLLPPRLAFFSTRTIQPGEWLSVDYAPEFKKGQGGSLRCLCGEPSCRKWVF